MWDWLRWLLAVVEAPLAWRASAAAPVGPPAPVEPPPDSLWLIVPPTGVRLLSSRPSRTGEGGQGIVARYSDGTTASAMVNSDGSVCVLFFRAGEPVPAIALGAGQFTWSSPSPQSPSPWRGRGHA
ncbi:MAG TPA: hypothetical protein VHS99_10050 [Chloroflexota bacterium]|nr:hypothetical protein [Chloroflexota bacterium]